MKSSFDENFYIVAATVIPVFYLALVIQFSWLDRVTSRLSNEIEKSRIPYEDSSGSDLSFGGLLRHLFIGGALICGMVIVILGIRGEVVSVLVLYRQAEGNGDRGVTLLAILTLACAAGLLPAWTVLLIFLRYLNGFFSLTKLSADLHKWWIKEPDEIEATSVERSTPKSTGVEEAPENPSAPG
jgi:hypothetical protein